MKIWIFGDSFANNISDQSWVTLLAKTHTVINKSSNGSSEYRIYKTYKQFKDEINPTDHVIFVHTSQSRIYLQNDKELDSRKLISHTKCDLIFNDVYHKKEKEYIDILKTIWDDEYFNDNYDLLIDQMLSIPNSTHITFFENTKVHNYYDIWNNNKGDINHMNEVGNLLVLDDIKSKINTYTRLIHFGASLTSGQGLDGPDDTYVNKLAKLLNIESINCGTPGASNLYILHDILNYKFVPGDCVIIMWAPCNRDTLFDNKGPYPIGPWQDTELAKNWMLTHSDVDLTIKAWYNIQHATLYLQSINIPCYNFAGYYKPLMKYKPDYINVNMLDSKMEIYRDQTEYASDGHPGPDAHTLVAKLIADIIK